MVDEEVILEKIYEWGSKKNLCYSYVKLFLPCLRVVCNLVSMYINCFVVPAPTPPVQPHHIFDSLREI